jgi:hypothetical protein
MKENHGHSLFDRIRIILGYLMIFGGAFALFFLNSFHNYGDTTLWLIGLGLLIGGIVTAGSHTVIDTIRGFFF